MVIRDRDSVDAGDGIVLGGVSEVGRVATGTLAEGAGKAQETSIATRQNDHGRNIFSERVLIVCADSFPRNFC
jgi:hypothetical protein